MPQEKGSGTSLFENSPADQSPADTKSSAGSFRWENGISRESAFALALENANVPEKDAYNVKMEWGGSPVTLEEAGDGRGRFEGTLFHDRIKYEFEIHPKAGIIFDWNAGLRK